MCLLNRPRYRRSDACGWSEEVEQALFFVCILVLYACFVQFWTKILEIFNGSAEALISVICKSKTLSYEVWAAASPVDAFLSE